VIVRLVGVLSHFNYLDYNLSRERVIFNVMI
jgi:hypothetical protein